MGGCLKLVSVADVAVIALLKKMPTRSTETGVTSDQPDTRTKNFVKLQHELVFFKILWSQFVLQLHAKRKTSLTKKFQLIIYL